jgi:hypothetical protein
MAGWRHAVELEMSGEDIGRLTDISRSRTEQDEGLSELPPHEPRPLQESSDRLR